jgi:O-antigen ligase
MKFTVCHQSGCSAGLWWWPAAALLFILPFDHTMVLRLFCLLLTGVAAARLYFRTPVPPLPLKGPLALWAGLAALSLLWSFNPQVSLNELKAEVGYAVLAFYSFFVLTRGEREWRLGLTALAGGLVTSALLLIWNNRAHLLSFVEYDWYALDRGVLYSTHLVLIAPFLLYLWLRAPLARFPHNLAWLLLPVFLGAGYMTLNRMFWPSLAMVLLVYAFLWRRAAHGARRGGWGVPAVAALGLAVAFFLFADVATQRPVEAHVEAHAASDSDSDSASRVIETLQRSERYEIWGFWLERVAERPLLGVGFGRNLPRDVYADQKPPHWIDVMFAHGHNLFLDYALQLGVAGLAVLLLLLASLLRAFWGLFRNPHADVSLVGICGVALLVAMVSKNMTDDLFWRGNGLLFWALAGMTLGYGKRLEDRYRTPDEVRPHVVIPKRG